MHTFEPVRGPQSDGCVFTEISLNIRLTVYEFLVAYDLKLRASCVLLGRGVKAARERAN